MRWRRRGVKCTNWELGKPYTSETQAGCSSLCINEVIWITAPSGIAPSRRITNNPRYFNGCARTTSSGTMGPYKILRTPRRTDKCLPCWTKA